MGILDLLRLPEHQEIGTLDDAAVTLLHGEILRRKPFLKNLYLNFYTILKRAIDADGNTPQKIVELGSGIGFVREVIPNAVTSDVLELPAVDMVFSAMEMPFEDCSVDAFIMIDVLHHIPDVRAFFREAERCLKPGGRIAMIEPGNTAWGRFVYQNFHHEAFDPSAGWEFESKGPLSTANGAIPWIVFHRDQTAFLDEFPQFEILKTQFHTPLRYLVSGGFTLRQLTPSWSYCIVKGLETLLIPLNRWIGMFETIVVRKRTN